MAAIQERFKNFCRAFTNKNEFLYKTIPKIGCVSYCIYSTKFLVSNEFSKICGDNSLIISNCLLFSSLLGKGMYLYSRKHLSMVQFESQRVLYSAYTSVLFNFGSILFWCLSKAYLPDNDLFRLSYALFTSIASLYIANNYLNIIDS